MKRSVRARTSPSSAPPLEDARKLWSHIYGDLEGFLCIATAVRRVDDDGVPIKKGNNATREFTNKFFHYPEEVDEALAYVHKVNSVPLREVWFSKTLFKTRRRGNDNVVGCRALAVELDGPDLPDGKLKPIAVVLSSPAHLNDDGKDHYHPYFAIDPSTPVDRASELNRRLGKKIGGEKTELSGLLRIPGTINWKHPEEPLVELLSLDEERHFDGYILDAMLPEEEGREYTRTGSASGGEPPVRLSGYDLDVWQGKHAIEDDRSGSLCKLAGVLWKANLQGAALRDALEERDVALGWEKYSGRPDADKRYWEIVSLVSSGGPWEKDDGGFSDTYAENGQSGSFSQADSPLQGDFWEKETEEEDSFPAKTLEQVIEEAGVETEWLIENLLARGELTLFSGRAKKAGKTTFCLSGIAASNRGDTHAGFKTRPARYLYLTEQGNNITQALKDTGFLDSETGEIFHGDCIEMGQLKDLKGMDWRKLVNRSAAYARKNNFDALVIDACASFARLKGSDEDKSGVVGEVVRVFRMAIQRENLAGLLLRHSGKNDEGRGSSAFEDEGDINVEYKRPPDRHSPTVRSLEIEGRHGFVQTNVQLHNKQFIALGDDRRIEFNQAVEEIRRILRNVKTREAGLKKGEIEERLGEGVSVSESTLDSALYSLAEEWGEIRREQLGTRGRPYVYWRPPPQAGGHDSFSQKPPGRGRDKREKESGEGESAYVSPSEPSSFSQEGSVREAGEKKEEKEEKRPPSSLNNIIGEPEMSEEEYEEEERLSRMPRKNPKRRGV